MQLKGLFSSANLWLKCLLILLIPSLFSILVVMPFSVIYEKGGIDYADSTIGLINFAELMQLSQSIVGMVLAALFLLYILFDEPWKAIGLDKPFYQNIIVQMALLTILWQPAIAVIADFNLSIQLPAAWSEVEYLMREMEASATEMIRLMIGRENFFDGIFTVFLIAVLPAVGEELLFRGVLQKTLTKHLNNDHIAIWISAFVFSFIHLQFFGFFPRLLLGALFGYLFVWTGRIWVPILAHFFNNAYAAISLLIYGDMVLEESAKSTYHIVDSFEYSHYLLALFMGSLAILIMRKIYLNYKGCSSTDSVSS